MDKIFSGRRGADRASARPLWQCIRKAALYAAISIATFAASRVDAAMLAQAPRQTDVPPMTFSREHPSSDLIIWQDEARLTDESTFDDFSSALLCTSDKSKGDCLTATLDRPSASGQFEERVGLTFTEEESGRTIVLTAVGHKLLEAPSFGARYMRLPDLTKTISVLGLDIPARASFGMKIPQSELARIPFGGVWKAALNMRLKIVGSGESAYAWTANITLRVFEDGQIVLFGEPEGDSTIRLNLYPEGKNVSAKTSFEICLSNGFSQFSSEYLLGLRDPHSDDENFYILPPGPNKGDGIRYVVSVGKEGWQVTSGATQIVKRVSGEHLRPVIDTATGNPRFCLPIPVHVSIPPFDPATKPAVEYGGTLRIEYTPRID